MLLEGMVKQVFTFKKNKVPLCSSDCLSNMSISLSNQICAYQRDRVLPILVLKKIIGIIKRKFSNIPSGKYQWLDTIHHEQYVHVLVKPLQ